MERGGLDLRDRFPHDRVLRELALVPNVWNNDGGPRFSATGRSEVDIGVNEPEKFASTKDIRRQGCQI